MPDGWRAYLRHWARIALPEMEEAAREAGVELVRALDGRATEEEAQRLWEAFEAAAWAAGDER